MGRPRYPTGQEIHAGDKVTLQGRGARVLFIKRPDGFSEFAAGVSAKDWDFITDDTVFLEFEDGSYCGFDKFCDDDEIVLLAREGAPGARREPPGPDPQGHGI